MAYEIVLSENRKYMIIKLSGKVTGELAWTFSLEVVKKGYQQGIYGFLFDIQEVVSVDFSALHRTFTFGRLNELEMCKTNRFALLRKPHELSHDLLVGDANENGYNACVFTDRDEAVVWLEE
jgi:hypothetical protein